MRSVIIAAALSAVCNGCIGEAFTVAPPDAGEGPTARAALTDPTTDRDSGVQLAISEPFADDAGQGARDALTAVTDPSAGDDAGPSQAPDAGQADANVQTAPDTGTQGTPDAGHGNPPPDTCDSTLCPSSCLYGQIPCCTPNHVCGCGYMGVSCLAN